MKHQYFIFQVLFFLLLIPFGSQSQTNLKYSKVKIYTNSTDLNNLSSLGIPVDEGVVKKGKYFITDLSEIDIKKIKENNFQYEILIDDVSKYYEDRNKGQNNTDNTTKKKSVSAYSCSTDNYPTPQYFSLGSVGGFYSYEELVTELDSMQQRFPNLVSVKQALPGTTIEGRTIWSIKISDNPNIDETEPKVLYSALTHAREPMGMQQLFFFMYYLLENYNTNSTIKYIVDNTELYFVPCVNPDGYKLNQTTNPNGGGMQRKNCRITGGNPKGVDLNRNYGFQWGYDDVGSSPITSDETYRGTAGFSEPETQIMKVFDEGKNFKLCIDYHTYSNILIYPWSYDNLLTPDSLIFRKYAQIMTKNNGFAYGTPMQTLSYNANGGSVDWFYGEQSTKNKIFGFSPEAGDGNDGFWPQISRIETIAKSFADMNLDLALFAGKYAELTDNNSYFINNSGYLKFNINSLGLDTPATFTVSVIPVNSAITSVGTSVTFNNMSFLETDSDSIFVTLSPSLVNGQQITYVYKIQDSYGIYYSDTITKIFGTPVSIFFDNANNMNNWTSTSWSTTSSSYYSASKSFTDSPSGNYPDNANNVITTTNFINLNNVVYAELSFWAKWRIEAGWDMVEVLASTNGTTWTPLCGKYNHPGNSYQDIDNPIYDGDQLNWVKEQIDLSNYIGQSIKLRFKLVSDSYQTYDGFYFDDINIEVISSSTNSEILNTSAFSIYPNPCNNILNILFPETNDYNIEILNQLGKSIYYKKVSSKNNAEINTQELLQGFYFIRITNKNGLVNNFKFIRK